MSKQYEGKLVARDGECHIPRMQIEGTGEEPIIDFLAGLLNAIGKEVKITTTETSCLIETLEPPNAETSLKYKGKVANAEGEEYKFLGDFEIQIPADNRTDTDRLSQLASNIFFEMSGLTSRGKRGRYDN